MSGADRPTDSARTALERLWSLAGCAPGALERIELTGTEPALPSVFPIGTAASACVGVAVLAATGRWLDGLGRIDGLCAPDPDLAAVADRLERRRTAFGEMTAVRNAEELPVTPPEFTLPSAPLGSHRCEWV